VADLVDVWDDQERPARLDRVNVVQLVLFHFSARGKTSGLDVGQIWTKGASLFHLRGGKVARLVQYFDRERALADLGLAPEAGSQHS
jgi:hypothetical protein